MSRPLKFLHLTTFYPPYSFGGDALYLYRLCHALGDGFLGFATAAFPELSELRSAPR